MPVNEVCLLVLLAFWAGKSSCSLCPSGAYASAGEGMLQWHCAADACLLFHDLILCDLAIVLLTMRWTVWARVFVHACLQSSQKCWQAVGFAEATANECAECAAGTYASAEGTHMCSSSRQACMPHMTLWLFDGLPSLFLPGCLPVALEIWTAGVWLR